MSKRKKALLVVAILSTIILAFMGGNAYSKYIVKVQGAGVAEVATWSFKVNGEEEQIQTINLASTCKEEDVAGNKIAPGTSGSFTIVVDGSGSDVGIEYDVMITNESQKPRNLKFKYQDREYNSISELAGFLSGRIDANEEDKIRTLKIDWEWKYETGSDPWQIEANDIIDTEDGKNISQYTFDVAVSGVQVLEQEV